ncbi:MAG: glycosyltransferase family 4 protein [Acidobacteriota bacterium]
MNIAFVSNLWPPAVFGGYELLAQQIAEIFKTRGHDVQVLTSTFLTDDVPGVTAELELTTDFPRPGDEVGAVDFSLGRQHRVRRANEAATRRWLEGLGERFRDGRGADVVFCWCLNRLSLGPVRAAQALGVPVCQTINDFHPRQFRTADPRRSWRSLPKQVMRWALERTLLRGTTLAGDPFPAAFISAALEDGLRLEGVDFADARVVPQGVPLRDFPFRPRTRRPDESLELIYVGQLSMAKGVHTLVRAVGFLKMRRPGIDVRLRVIGGGVPSYRRYLERLCTDFAVTDVVEFVGPVDHADIPDWHHRSHVLVFPSEWPEPFGLSHLEAMASGCAVVSTLTGGSAELIEADANALAFDAGNYESLAEELGALADDEDLRVRLIQQARRHVVEHFSLDAYASRLLDFLTDVRGSRRRSRSRQPIAPLSNILAGSPSTVD